MGKYDLVEQVLEKLGAQFFFTGVLIQPGKPLVFGELRGASKTTPFFGLPGNPVSTMVTFQLFVRPVLDALAGARPQAPLFAQAQIEVGLQGEAGADAISAGTAGWNARATGGGAGEVAGLWRSDGDVAERTATL